MADDRRSSREIYESIPASSWQTMRECNARYDVAMAALFAFIAAVCIAVAASPIQESITGFVFGITAINAARALVKLRAAYKRRPQR